MNDVGRGRLTPSKTQIRPEPESGQHPETHARPEPQHVTNKLAPNRSGSGPD